MRSPQDRLAAALPTLWEHRCSEGRPGGFLERLRAGTYMGHILEHVVLELQSLAGLEVDYGEYTPEERETLRRIAVSRDLISTGGRP